MLNLPKPRDRGKPQVCVDHKKALVIANELLLQCPVEDCEIIAVRNDLQKKLKLYFVTCKTCNYCYPSPDPEKCVICDEETQARLDQMVTDARA